MKLIKQASGKKSIRISKKEWIRIGKKAKWYKTAKYLSEYMEEAQTQAFDKYGAFFAFNKKQLDEKKQEGVQYVNLGGGLICPKESALALHKELDEIYKDSIKQDLAENGVEGVIKRELSNHECYYTGDVSDCEYKLKDYGITKEQIVKVFRQEASKHYDD
jgi:hypothetical protein